MKSLLNCKPETILINKITEEALKRFDAKVESGKWENDCCGCPDSLKGINGIRSYLKSELSIALETVKKEVEKIK